MDIESDLSKTHKRIDSEFSIKSGSGSGGSGASMGSIGSLHEFKQSFELANPPRKSESTVRSIHSASTSSPDPKDDDSDDPFAHHPGTTPLKKSTVNRSRTVSPLSNLASEFAQYQISAAMEVEMPKLASPIRSTFDVDEDEDEAKDTMPEPKFYFSPSVVDNASPADSPASFDSTLPLVARSGSIPAPGAPSRNGSVSQILDGSSSGHVRMSIANSIQSGHSGLTITTDESHIGHVASSFPLVPLRNGKGALGLGIGIGDRASAGGGSVRTEGSGSVSAGDSSPHLGASGVPVSPPSNLNQLRAKAIMGSPGGVSSDVSSCPTSPIDPLLEEEEEKMVKGQQPEREVEASEEESKTADDQVMDIGSPMQRGFSGISLSTHKGGLRPESAASAPPFNPDENVSSDEEEEYKGNSFDLDESDRSKVHSREPTRGASIRSKMSAERLRQTSPTPTALGLGMEDLAYIQASLVRSASKRDASRKARTTAGGPSSIASSGGSAPNLSRTDSSASKASSAASHFGLKQAKGVELQRGASLRRTPSGKGFTTVQSFVNPPHEEAAVEGIQASIIHEESHESETEQLDDSVTSPSRATSPVDSLEYGPGSTGRYTMQSFSSVGAMEGAIEDERRFSPTTTGTPSLAHSNSVKSTPRISDSSPSFPLTPPNSAPYGEPANWSTMPDTPVIRETDENDEEIGGHNKQGSYGSTRSFEEQKAKPPVPRALKPSASAGNLLDQSTTSQLRPHRLVRDPSTTASVLIRNVAAQAEAATKELKGSSDVARRNLKGSRRRFLLLSSHPLLQIYPRSPSPRIKKPLSRLWKQTLQPHQKDILFLIPHACGSLLPVLVCV
ncbi:hypothetical protein BT69DRAFT_1281040 [Atractiella rhizophila]|nr:hypothetical protein BT69DRAFT_1281040 [Atractiella rhizophila]